MAILKITHARQSFEVVDKELVTSRQWFSRLSKPIVSQDVLGFSALKTFAVRKFFVVNICERNNDLRAWVSTECARCNCGRIYIVACGKKLNEDENGFSSLPTVRANYSLLVRMGKCVPTMRETRQELQFWRSSLCWEYFVQMTMGSKCHRTHYGYFEFYLLHNILGIASSGISRQRDDVKGSSSQARLERKRDDEFADSICGDVPIAAQLDRRCYTARTLDLCFLEAVRLCDVGYRTQSWKRIPSLLQILGVGIGGLFRSAGVASRSREPQVGLFHRKDRETLAHSWRISILEPASRVVSRGWTWQTIVVWLWFVQCLLNKYV